MKRKKTEITLAKKARTSRSHVKNMLVCFIDYKGIVHCEFISKGPAVNNNVIWK